MTNITAPLATGRYGSWRPGDGVPIRTTVGYPRFWRHGDLLFIRLLAPFGIFGKGLDPDEAHRLYLARLDGHAEEILVALTDVANQHPGRTLCLLCFEDVHQGEACHRRWFADWYQQHFGVEVPELAP
jgi:hypothetical protein